MRHHLSNPAVRIPALSLLLVLGAFLLSPLFTGTPIVAFDVYNAFQGFAAIGFIALGLGLTMIVGEYDLSVAANSALASMVAVMMGEKSGLVGVLIAVAIGLVVGVLQGLVIAKLQISAIPVTLATYIGLLGLTKAISGGQNKSYENYDVTLWVDQQVLTVFSPRSLACFTVFLLAAFVLWRTRLGRELRAIGSDRRAARVVGIPVERYLTVLFAVSGLLAAFGGALLGYSYGSASADPSIQPLILGTVAALLGGVSLMGGRGNGLSLLGGALTVAFLAQVVVMAAMPDFYTQLFYALLLGVIVLIDAPDLRRILTTVKARSTEPRPNEHDRVPPLLSKNEIDGRGTHGHS